MIQGVVIAFDFDWSIYLRLKIFLLWLIRFQRAAQTLGGFDQHVLENQMHLFGGNGLFEDTGQKNEIV